MTERDALDDLVWGLAERLRTPEEAAAGGVWGGYLTEAQRWIDRILETYRGAHR